MADAAHRATGYGESPYQSGSTHAGNPMLIDLELLREEGLLDAELPDPASDPDRVDFPNVRARKEALLRLSFQQSFARVKEDVREFSARQAWSPDGKETSTGWTPTPSTPPSRMPAAELCGRSGRNQYQDVRRVDAAPFRRAPTFTATAVAVLPPVAGAGDFAHAKGIALFGDMPIYVAEDSADTWAEPELFQLDKKDFTPLRVAGVPPDYFCADGQRWGNPLYDWKKMRRDRFRWWLRRLHSAGAMFDWLRIDHFIGFANYYSIPASCPTAREGKWVKSPGKALFKRVEKALPDLKIVAEGPGRGRARVRKLIDYFGYPGMKVIEFGFDSDEQTPLPRQHRQKLRRLHRHARQRHRAGLVGQGGGAGEGTGAQDAAPAENICEAMIECVFASVAETAIVPMQDFLHLGGEARMNFPGTVGGNWLWRMRPGAGERRAGGAYTLSQRAHRPHGGQVTREGGMTIERT